MYAEYHSQVTWTAKFQAPWLLLCRVAIWSVSTVEIVRILVLVLELDVVVSVCPDYMYLA